MACSFLHNSYQRLGSTGAQSISYHTLHKSPQFDTSNIIINFTTGSYSKVQRAKRESGTANTIFSFRSPYRFNSRVKVEQTKAVKPLSSNSYGASSTNALDEKMEENYRRLQAKYVKFLEDNDVRPSEARAHIIGELNSAIANCLDLTVASLGDIQGGRGTLYFSKPDQDQPFEFNVLSAGEKEVVDILLDLYLRKEDYEDTIFLIDEPELHLNSAIQRKLLLEISKLVGENCQIWIATHSIGFLRALQDELRDDCQIIYFEPETDFASSPHKLETNRKNLAKLGADFSNCTGRSSRTSKSQTYRVLRR